MPSNSDKPPGQASSRARRAAAQMAAEARQDERRRTRGWKILGVIVGVAVAAALTLAVATAQRAQKAPATAAGLAKFSGVGAVAPPPWSPPEDSKTRVAQAGLRLGQMGTAEHYHAHLNLVVDGRPVQVPPGIGIDPSTGEMSALHTHTPDGVLHIEAGTKGQPFTLGQLFTEWNVKLTADQVGSLNVTKHKQLVLYVNGKRRTEDPALLRLEPDQQIALAYGTPKANADLPTSFDFSAVR